MKNIILLLFLLLSLLNCQDGPKAAFNDEFVPIALTMKIPIEKLVGKYVLDNDSKKRYNISDKGFIMLDIQKNKKIIANKYLDVKTWKLKNEKMKFSYYYYYYSDKIGTNIGCPELNDGGVINLYYRKKDSAIVLYVYTHPLKGQEHGDYLRYIKVK
ncbi:hypothetical protein [Cloacibacterium sp. TD35]|uniref:hypothetical protein n=1 Tax=Cloacibacterium sp. TD35 TaxID=2976818 RepID=UPI00237DD793|nr:hypothetical protein [Cloacibacterium sp. TD35]WDT67295.1 hypothetical protein N7277_08105 [Cloacibacterium sp. TD35]